MNVIKARAGLLAFLGTVALWPLPLPAKEPSSALELARQLNQAFIEVADKVSPAVVVIRVAHRPDYNGPDDNDNPFFDLLPREFRRRYEERRQRTPHHSREPIFDSEASGIVIREDGYILTNRHVVEDADKIKVRFKDGKEYNAEVRGQDAQSDLAVIKIDGKGLTVARLADSSKTRVGEFAIAIGAPFELDYSVTFGHVSAKGRHIIFGEEGAAMDQDFIQTDASINPGNSGGPLVNIDGEVIGVNSMIRGLRTGIGFAIPSSLAKEISDKLIVEGKVTRAWLGVGIRDLSDYAEFKDTIGGVEEGVVVSRILRDGPASRSDLKASDVITAVDGKRVSTAQELKNEFRDKKIGSMVTLAVARPEGANRVKNLKIKVKAEEWPDESLTVVAARRETSEGQTANLGVTVKTLTRELAKRYGAAEVTDGVIVTEVEADSPAARSEIKSGDVITEVNHQRVTSPKQFRDAIRNADARKGVTINLISDGTRRFEVLKDSGD